MAMDSNKPYQRVNVQANNNDTIWNGAAWGAGAGIGAMGVTYGATMHGATGLEKLNYKAAGNKTVREITRAGKLQEKGKPHMSMATIKGMHDFRVAKADVFAGRMGSVRGFGNTMFGSKGKMVGAAATGLMGGMLAGAGIDQLK
jgi:hypothetical protein